MQHRPNDQWGREHERSGRGAPRGDGRRDRNARPEQHAADDSYERESESQRYGDDPFDRPYGRPAFDGDRDRGDFGSYGSDRQRRDRPERDPQGYGASEWRRRFGGADWQQPNYGGAGYYGGEGFGGGGWDAGGGGFESGRQGQGRYQGKGPKGYQRADDRVIDDVCQALERDPYIDASEIEVSCQKGEIVLKGNVESRDAKRRAEHCIEDLPGVKDVRNELRPSHDGPI
jgi:hypothetical protein